ncbi:IS200/IS605 family transposase [Marinobacter bryozoorum]|jgi:putative transposase|uniref:IS200/IS605 family transposase n=1 Tax=Marinobacter bryozoorum TaxID=256324 RepID=UPI0020056D47|nr:IS200/IS605 family transposase [Marinobacter bryozoorum]MCK7546058.1 IS200/IS605 family transposase [Marinobacter bryozoorum]
MSNDYDWRTGRTCHYKLHYHLVFTPKYRRKVFTDAMLTRLEAVFRETCEQMDGELLEFNGESDHVHLLASCPPKTALSNFIGKLKGKSAYVLRSEFWPEIQDKLWGSQFWSPSYCVVSCGGAPLEIVEQYIRDQQRPPGKQAAEHSARLRQKKD